MRETEAGKDSWNAGRERKSGKKRGERERLARVRKQQ